MAGCKVLRWLALLALPACAMGVSTTNGTSESPAVLLDASRLPLSTKGQDIVDANGEKVRLACVNWYGAHMEQYAVSGLHKRPLADITSQIVDMGFNCIRLPFSLELIVKDPPVPDFAIAGDPSLQGLGLTGMQLLDRTIETFRDNNLLVVLNNHNSKAGWCCAVESDEGLWNTPEYSTDAWIDALGQITARYANFTNVVAFDLRNEIHDVGDKIITWGTSDDKDLDWKVASELAAERVIQEDQDLLIIFSGLCFGGELRPMLENPPRISTQNKLVWTTHTYGFSLWWNIIEDMTGVTWDQWNIAAIITPIVFCVISSVLLLGPVRSDAKIAFKGDRKRAWALSLLSWAIPLSLLFIASGVAWRISLMGAGCLVVSQPANLTIYISAALGVAALIGLVALKAKPSALLDDAEENGKVAVKDSDEEAGLAAGSSTSCCLPGCITINLLIACIVIVTCSISLAHFSSFAQTYDIYEWDLKTKWGLETSQDPIWVGEFGGNTRNDWWVDLTTVLLKKYQMSWAYWALDGERWFNETQEWKLETYGILDQDYQSIQHPEMLKDMHGIQQFN